MFFDRMCEIWSLGGGGGTGVQYVYIGWAVA